MVTTGFELTPVGPFSLAASTRFLEGFAPAAYEGDASHGDGSSELEMAFCVDGHWDTVAVRVEQEKVDGAVIGKIHSASKLGRAVRTAAVAQVERILSLDVDGAGFPAVGRRDPVVERLQTRYSGLRPVCFWSPYEAAAWAVIGQRIRIVPAAPIKARMAEQLGDPLQIGDRSLHAFPAPATLSQLDSFEGLNDTKLDRLRGVATAALDGALGAEHLRSLPRDEALDELQNIPGIGPFSAELILLRGAGDPDHAPTAEPRLCHAIERAYDLDHSPTTAEVAEISDAWATYRTWVTVLLRNMLEDETGQIAGRGRQVSAGS
ncbi:DNA-3-methyladenine glycosylase [soil metagenome]